jgi:hypothetical protein
MLRTSRAVTRLLQTPLSRRGEGQLKVYTKSTATSDPYLVLSSSVHLVIAWNHSTLSNFSTWRHAFLYLLGDCQIWLYLINGLLFLYCFNSCSSKANSDHISIWTQLRSWALFLEHYSRCVEFSKIQQPAEGHSVDVCPSKTRTLFELEQQTRDTGPLLLLPPYGEGCCLCLPGSRIVCKILELMQWYS